MDGSTREEIDNEVTRVLREAGLTDPPIMIEDILEHLQLDREFYDLEDPSLLRRFWHKVRVRGQRLIKVVKKVNLAAVWLPDEEQILVDSSLPRPKQKWASFHDSIHSVLPWHREYFLGDTAQTLDPDFQEMLENEANYGASAAMFGVDMFTKDALDTSPCWSSVETLSKRYDKSLVTTLRRYVGFSHDRPMIMVISTPSWMDKPLDQKFRWRHIVTSNRFDREFAPISPNLI
jgi:hypothetical protein